MKKIKKGILFFILVALIAQPLEAREFYSKIFADIAREANKSIVIVFGGADLFSETPVVIGSGAGFFVGSNLIMTANHILAFTANELYGIGKLPEFAVQLFSGEKFKATIVRQDSVVDIAILKIEVAKEKIPPPLKLGDSSKVEAGDIVMAIGHPLGFFWTLTTGVISALRKTNELPQRDFLQSDVAINPGNSGGPLINLEGEIIGVITLVAQNHGIAVAVPINAAKELLAQAAEEEKKK